MINLINLEEFTKNFTPVTSPDYVIGKGTAVHPGGLFSEVIFGSKDSIERRKQFSFIDLNCKVLHPALYTVIKRLDRKIIFAIERKATYTINEMGDLVEDKEGKINGILSIIEHFDKIRFRSDESEQRADLVKMLNSYYEKDMVFISKILVIPAYYRDIEIDPVHSTIRIDPINDFYIKILRLSLQLQPVQSGDVFNVLSTRMSQLVLETYQYFAAKLGKKQGLIRSNVLGKRSDFTARGVITGASSEIKVDEIGVPVKMLVKIFEPFIIHDLTKSGNVSQSELSHALRAYNSMSLSIPTLRSLITGIYKGDELTGELESIIKLSVQRVVRDKIVLAKRDPAINSESVQAFHPVMIDGNTIKLNILKCSGFNADFDGDSIFGRICISYGKNKQIWSGKIDELENVEIK